MKILEVTLEDHYVKKFCESPDGHLKYNINDNGDLSIFESWIKGEAPWTYITKKFYCTFARGYWKQVKTIEDKPEES